MNDTLVEDLRRAGELLADPDEEGVVDLGMTDLIVLLGKTADLLESMQRCLDFHHDHVYAPQPPVMGETGVCPVCEAARK